MIVLQYIFIFVLLALVFTAIVLIIVMHKAKMSQGTIFITEDKEVYADLPDLKGLKDGDTIVLEVRIINSPYNG